MVLLYLEAPRRLTIWQTHRKLFALRGCVDRITDILGQVRSPLGFFTLALLIVEVSIGGTIAVTDLESFHKLIALGVMAGLFLVVVGVVAWITFSRPRNLQEDVTTLQEILTSAGLKDAIEDVIVSRIRPDCLTPRSGPQEGDSE